MVKFLLIKFQYFLVKFSKNIDSVIIESLTFYVNDGIIYTSEEIFSRSKKALVKELNGLATVNCTLKILI